MQNKDADTDAPLTGGFFSGRKQTADQTREADEAARFISYKLDMHSCSVGGHCSFFFEIRSAPGEKRITVHL